MANEVIVIIGGASEGAEKALDRTRAKMKGLGEESKRSTNTMRVFGEETGGAIDKVRGLERGMATALSVITGPIGMIGAVVSLTAALGAMANKMDQAVFGTEKFKKASDAAAQGATTLMALNNPMTPRDQAENLIDVDALQHQVDAQRRRERFYGIASNVLGNPMIAQGPRRDLAAAESALEVGQRMLVNSANARIAERLKAEREGRTAQSFDTIAGQQAGHLVQGDWLDAGSKINVNVFVGGQQIATQMSQEQGAEAQSAAGT